MRLGITMFTTDLAMEPHELAGEAEERGFSSFFMPEHTHIPVSRKTPAPTRGGYAAERLTGTPAGSPQADDDVKGGAGDLPPEYRRTLDPFVSLAAAAVVTERIRLGTGILLPAQRDPIVTAKAVATLDRLARGRFTLGVGYGWNAEEAADHGVPWERRRAVARENVLAMRALWTEDEASFKGEFAAFEPSWSWPKPAGRVPVLIGGAAGPVLFAHIAEYGDGWIPIGGAGLREAMPALRAACEAAGREMVPVVPFGTLPTRAKLGYYASIGIEEVVVRVPSAGRDVVLPQLDDYARTYL